MSIKGFMMSLDDAEEFFKRCAEAKANTHAERMAIMNQLLHERNIKILNQDRIKKVLTTKKALYIHTKRGDNGRDIEDAA